MVKLIGPLTGSPERKSLSSWRMLWLSIDPAPRDHWKLGPAWKSRAAGLVGEKKSSLTVISRGAAPARAGSASSAAVAETTRNLRAPVTFLASTCLLQLHRDRAFWSTTPTTPRFKLGKSHGGRDRGCPAGGRARKPGRLVARHRTRPSAPRLR